MIFSLFSQIRHYKIFLLLYCFYLFLLYIYIKYRFVVSILLLIIQKQLSNNYIILKDNVKSL